MDASARVSGRGAFPGSGAGGTLRHDRGSTSVTVPGPFYMRAGEGSDMVGVAAFRKLRAGAEPDVNELAVHYGVRAIQSELNRQVGERLAVDGLFGAASDAAVRRFQERCFLTVDGVAGPATCRRLFRATVEYAYAGHVAPVRIGTGLVTYESGWDPGAVGRSDPDDLGLCQINGRAHPDLSAATRLSPLDALTWQADFLDSLIRAMSNERDAVAAYNLGVAGARRWIALGRPDPYTPPGSTASRSVVTYVDKVLAG